jgi:NADH-quinone oxidoreductase subunit N
MAPGLHHLGPELALAATAVVLALADVLWARHPGRGARLSWLAAGGMVVAAVALLAAPAADSAVFSGMVAVDGFARFFRGLFLAAALFAVAFASLSDEVPAERAGEYLVLLCCLCLGLCLMVAAQNLLLLYLSIELVSVPSYVLAGFRRGDRRSSEAALKYVIYGGVASGLMLYGFSFMYGLSGTLELPGIGAKLAEVGHAQPALRMAIALAALLSLAGFGYKVAAVPFHMWCPDVYEGAPTPFVAFLSVAPKAAGLAALLRFVLVGFGADGAVPDGPEFPWSTMIGVLSVATMTLGNLAAIAQNNLKRLLAYSSIAHAGYMLTAVAAATAEGQKAVMVYLGIYLFMNLGAFLAVIAVRERTGSETIEAYRGLGSASPYLAAMLAVFLFSLTGLPPLGGFIGKFTVFAALIRTERPFFYVVALIGVLNSAVSLYYYARVVKVMYLEPPQTPIAPMPVGRSHAVLLTALAVPTVLFGVFWAPLAGTVERFSSLLR